MAAAVSSPPKSSPGYLAALGRGTKVQLTEHSSPDRNAAEMIDRPRSLEPSGALVGLEGCLKQPQSIDVVVAI